MTEDTRTSTGGPRSPWRRAWARFRRHRMAHVSLWVLTALVLLAVAAPLVSELVGYSFDGMDLGNRSALPSGAHPLGTDDAGRDVLVRVLYGGRVSLAVAVAGALTAALLGTAVGVLAGHYGGWVDTVLMRLVDATLSLPILALLIIVSAIDLSPGAVEQMVGQPGPWPGVVIGGLFLGGAALVGLVSSVRGRWILAGALAAVGTFLLTGIYLWLEPTLVWLGQEGSAAAAVVRLVCVIGLFGWMTAARLVRGQVLSIRELEYIEAARALGAPPRRIIWRHLVPNALGPVFVAATLAAGSFILYEAVLSFLGLGIAPPVPSWGNMLMDAQQQMLDAPHVAVFPGVMIVIAVSCLNFIGDGLRDAFDPRHQRE